MLSVLTQFADTRKEQLNSKPTISDRVIEYIIDQLPKGRVSVESTAETFYMARSTLLRRLKQENTTFQSLMDATRKDLAITYLQRDLATSEIADLLGFSSPSAFQHSFKRWFGTSPGEMKRLM